MTNDRDEQLDTGEQEYSLEEILAEIASSQKREGDFVVPAVPTRPGEKPDEPDLLLSVIKRPEPKKEERPAPKAAVRRPKAHQVPEKAASQTAPSYQNLPDTETDPPPTAEKPEPKRVQQKVIQFPDRKSVV